MTASKQQPRTPKVVYPTISEAAYLAVKQWLKEARQYAQGENSTPPNDALLRVGLPQGSILAITRDWGLQVRDTATSGDLRSPRWLDPAAVALIRLLLAGGGSIGLNRKNMHRPNRKDYLHVRVTLKGRNNKVPLLRIITDTPAGYQTPAADDHCSYRRADLSEHAEHYSSHVMVEQGLPTKHPHLGRREAINLAISQLRKSEHRKSFNLSEEELRAKINDALVLLDMIALKRPG